MAFEIDDWNLTKILAKQPLVLLRVLGAFACAHTQPSGDGQENMDTLDDIARSIAEKSDLTAGCLNLPEFLRDLATLVDLQLASQIGADPEWVKSPINGHKHLFQEVLERTSKPRKMEPLPLDPIKPDDTTACANAILSACEDYDRFTMVISLAHMLGSTIGVCTKPDQSREEVLEKMCAWVRAASVKAALTARPN